MLPIIAWRNVWRSRIRSLVVMLSIFLGVWALIFLMSFSTAMVNDYVNNAIRFQTSHVQIHHPDFVEDKELKYLIPDADELVLSVKEQPFVESVSLRTIANGMIRSSRGARGIVIKGVEPQAESRLTQLEEKLVEGEFLNTNKKNQVMISQEMAEKLHLKLRKKVVLQFQDLNGDITAGSFRVVGIYKTGNTVVDLSSVMVLRKDLNRLIGDELAAHEVAIKISDIDEIEGLKTQLSEANPQLIVEHYRDLSPDVKLYEQQIGVSLTIFGVIFMLALIFGIINTMLMAVLERTRELGVLMAVGMNKLRVFGMVMLETLLLGLIGAPLGLFAGYLTVSYFGKHGIDLGAFADGIEQFGMNTVVYPLLSSDIYLKILIAVMITSLLAAIYPAIKAVNLKPMDAIRKI